MYLKNEVVLFDLLVEKIGPIFNISSFFLCSQISGLITSHMTKLGTNVCIYHIMFNAKYEEDSSISSKVMANSIFEM